MSGELSHLIQHSEVGQKVGQTQVLMPLYTVPPVPPVPPIRV